MERSEIIYVVSEAADMAVRKHAEVEGFTVDDPENEGHYTEEAQMYFDTYYDEYDDFAEKWITAYPNATSENLLRVITMQSGLVERPQAIEWSNCAIAFYWEGVEEDLDGDIYFEPGYYMWNEHTIRNWKDDGKYFDFVYLMQATGERLNEDGTPKVPELYRMCDKGVVVRRLTREHESGGPRPSFENRTDYVFIIDVPGSVRISGEEFHFVPLKHEWMYLYNKNEKVAYPIIPKVEYDSGAYDTNWLNRVLEDHNDLDFVSSASIGGATVKSNTILYNKE